MTLSPADYMVFFCYIIAVVLIGFWVARRENKYLRKLLGEKED